MVVVGGDAGIGKSTLIGEAARLAGADLLVGRCLPMGGGTIPLAPLGELLRTIRRARPAVMERPAARAVIEWLSPGASAPPTAATRIFGPMVEVVGDLVGEHPAMVVIEDLHWADPATWDLFDYLARNLTEEPVVVVGSYRSNEVGADPELRRRLGEIVRLPRVHRIHLTGLDREATAARIAALLGEAPAPDLVDEIMSRGQGNPFFTGELVTAYRAGDRLPAALSDLVGSEIDGVPDDARTVASVVATVGHDCAHAVVAPLAGLDDDRLEQALEDLVASQILIVDGDTYRFRHALIGEVAYARLLPPQRARLHRRVADHLLDQRSPRLHRPDGASEVAFHLDRAGAVTEAFPWLLTAADVSEHVAPAAAYRHLVRALELWDDAGDATSGESRADRYWQAAELATATVSNERAVELAEAARPHGPPSRGEAWSHERLARALWGAGRIDESRAEYQRAADLLQADDEAGAAGTLAGIGQGMLMFCDYAAAERWCLRAAEQLVDRSDDPNSWAMANRVLGLVATHSGDIDRGVDLCRAAYDAAEGAPARALAAVYLAMALGDAGRAQEAVDLALDASAEAQSTGVDRSFGPYLDAVAAEALLRVGDWSQADVVLTSGRGVDTLPIGRTRWLCSTARLAARRGHEEAVHAALAQLDETVLDPWHRLVVSAARADALLHLGDWAGAAAAAGAGWDVAALVAPVIAGRLLRLEAAATVEATLDALARKEGVDIDEVVSPLAAKLQTVNGALGATSPPITAAELADAAASLTRLTRRDADVWAEVGRRWHELPDPLAAATARLHEADAAAANGETARATDALRDAHLTAVELGAARLLVQVEATATRARISLDAATPVALEGDVVERLGLTSREAEVLALVAAGRTNRQIGEELYVSEKTASVHVSNILRKLGVSTRVDAAAVAQRVGVG